MSKMNELARQKMYFYTALVAVIVSAVALLLTLIEQ